MRNDISLLGSLCATKLVLSAVLGLGAFQLANAYEVKSWSYVNTPAGMINDDHWSDVQLYQGSSLAEYDSDNYAKSSVGTGSGGSLEAKIAVGATPDISGRQAYSISSYRDGWHCDTDTCASMPSSSTFNIHLMQDGTFTFGTANFSLMYFLKTEAMAYSFHFAVQQADGMPLAPYGWLSQENLVTGAMSSVDISTLGIEWQALDDGMYRFSYDVSFSGVGHVAPTEELTLSSYVYGTSNQYFESYNSFHATLTPQDGMTWVSDGGRRISQNTSQNGVPEPGSFALLGIGLIGLGFVFRRGPEAWR